MTDATTTSADTTTTSATTTAATPWYAGIAGVDQAMVGHLQAKGWDKKSAGEAAIEAVKAYKEAEHFVGVPAAQLLRMPKDAADEVAWNTVWSRLGKPADAKGYEFGDLKKADGTPADEALINTIRETAFKANLPKDAAAQVAREIVKFTDDRASAAAIEQQAKVAQEKVELAKNWGANFEANKFVAGRAAAALGVDPETVSRLEGVVGYAKIMEMFRSIGARIGEDKFIQGDGAARGPMTKESARAKLEDLKKDDAFVKRYMAGDVTARREMDALHVLIAS